MSATNLPVSDNSSDSSSGTKNFFNNYFTAQVSYPAGEIDAVVGFFLKRGFDEQSAKSTAIVILNQAKLDDVNVFQLIDTLKGLSDVQLSQVVSEILNQTRQKTSVLGYRLLNVDETFESRNIKL
ncbi:hypothetical protein EBU71_18450 [bacterium]|nr:hypothetical protein [Candidatus Elulimicrobium humile]